MAAQVTGRVHSVESFGTVDRPGVRFGVCRDAYASLPNVWTCWHWGVPNYDVGILIRWSPAASRWPPGRGM